MTIDFILVKKLQIAIEAIICTSDKTMNILTTNLSIFITNNALI